MRATLFISGTVLLVAIGALLVWRPAMTLALALLGGAISVWRMHRPHRPAVPPRPAITVPDEVVEEAVTDETPEEAPPEPVTEADNTLRDRIAAAGWQVAETAVTPWLLAQSGDVRVAAHHLHADRRVTKPDIENAMVARVRERAQYAAIVCEHRPTNAVAALAKESRIHIVNLARLEAYLLLAGAFKPAQQPAPAKRVTA